MGRMEWDRANRQRGIGPSRSRGGLVWRASEGAGGGQPLTFSTSFLVDLLRACDETTRRNYSVRLDRRARTAGEEGHGILKAIADAEGREVRISRPDRLRKTYSVSVLQSPLGNLDL